MIAARSIRAVFVQALPVPSRMGSSGALRPRWGETFVLRIDGAWSPGNAAAYFDVGHVF